MSRKRWLYLAVSLVLALSLLAIGCAKPAAPPPAPAPPAPAPAPPTPAPAPPPKPAPTPPPPKPIKVKWSSYLAPTHHLQKEVIQRWADEVEKRTEGRVEVEMYAGGALHGAKEGIKAIRSGITDFTCAWVQYDPAGFEVALGQDAPFLFPNNYVAIRTFEELYPKYVKEEYEAKGLLLLAYWSTSPYGFLAFKEPVLGVEDLKGKKVRSSGGLHNTIIEALGGTPVQMATPEIYTSLQRGILDGCLFSIASGTSYKLYEIYPNILDVGVVVAGLASAMNPKTWDALPEDIQKIIYQVNRESGMWCGASYSNQDVSGIDVWRKAGAEINTVSPEELKLFQEATANVMDVWIEKCEKVGKGDKARAYLADMKKSAEKYSAMSLEELKKVHIATGKEIVLHD